MKRFVVPVMFAFALAGCSKPDAENKSAAPGAPMGAADVGGPAQGKWRLTTSMAGQTMPPIEVCYDHRMTFAEAQAMQKDVGMTCSEQSYRREGATVVGHTVCTMDERTMTTDTRITGDFNAAYLMDITSTMSPAPMPELARTQMQIEAERIGDC